MSTAERAGVTVDDLLHFLDCWNRHDIDGILGTLTDDCLYITSDGIQLSGIEETRAGLSRFLETYPDARWHNDTHFVAGSRGASEWVMTATGPDGTRIELDSCDLFEFRNSKISRVSAYRRTRPE